ncbi:thioredoxin fold domain-containing protein [Rivibacter subsaxonicus]|uniref:Thioredoxin-like protein n=1 Tax=Rivibacter subsaxonicus TaxID=457575 RepID=A0A4Q7VXG3_9BURK|nr:thioredoxin fold domain-containing protein [Rivibacter subsaxonicus]RZU01039.1 thioredoxin-like protein [Rivibacter subsaxonicus]
MIFSRSSAAGLALLGLLAGCSRPSDPPAAPVTAAAPVASSVAWLKAGTDAEVDAAFARAAAEGKPVFLYWGATWCPPCNQVKATIFPRADFIERSQGFVPVYVDGDLPGAQKLGERFKVRGYPTMVLFRPDGSELTRLPGEVDAGKYLQVLALGLSEAQPVKAALARALSQPASLKAEDWRQLAFYSWDTDEQQLLSPGRKAATLQQLAAASAAAPPEVATRLRLQALVAAAEPGAAKLEDPAAARAQLVALLGDAAASREQQDILANSPDELVAVLGPAGSTERTELQAALDAALVRLNADTGLSQGDRMNALVGRVELARLAGAKAALPVPLIEQLRADVARADREVTSEDERQSVIPSAAHALAQAGLFDESDKLLEAELKRSHSPYYAMLQLASNARKRGDAQAALGWYERAFNESRGPATRVQWGAGYVNALLELAPQDSARIERAAAGVYGELRGQPDAFYARTARSVERMNGKLAGWAQASKPARAERAGVIKRLHGSLDELCHGLPEADVQRTTCGELGRTLLAAPKPAKSTAT